MNSSNDNTVREFYNDRCKVFARLYKSGHLMKYEKAQYRIRVCNGGHGFPVKTAREAAALGAQFLVINEDSGQLRWVISMEDLLQCDTRTLADEEKFMIPQSKCKFYDRSGKEVLSPQEQERRSQRKQPPACSPQRALFDVDPSGNRWGHER
jgi:hypothetical protein